MPYTALLDKLDDLSIIITINLQMESDSVNLWNETHKELITYLFVFQITYCTELGLLSKCILLLHSSLLQHLQLPKVSSRGKLTTSLAIVINLNCCCSSRDINAIELKHWFASSLCPHYPLPSLSIFEAYRRQCRYLNLFIITVCISAL